MKYTKKDFEEIRMNVELLLICEADISIEYRVVPITKEKIHSHQYTIQEKVKEKGILKDYIKRTLSKHSEKRIVWLIESFLWGDSRFYCEYEDIFGEALDMMKGLK